MGKRLDQILIVDLECTCWDGPAPEGQESEIIEIGICTLEVSTGERLLKRSLLVRPTRSEVSPFCTALTTLTPEDVADGIGFDQACTILRNEYHSRERVWASYGDFDRRQFERQCSAFGVAYPFGTTHLNVKTLFALMRRLPHEVGMDQALRLAGRELEGTHHRGADDAWNIAGLLSELITR